MKKIFFRTTVLLLVYYCMPTILFAQGPANPCPDPALSDCPIDSNLIVLFAAAVLVAAKKAYDYHKIAILK